MEHYKIKLGIIIYNYTLQDMTHIIKNHEYFKKTETYYTMRITIKCFTNMMF